MSEINFPDFWAISLIRFLARCLIKVFSLKMRNCKFHGSEKYNLAASTGQATQFCSFCGDSKSVLQSYLDKTIDTYFGPKYTLEFWIRNTYFLARVWIFFSFVRGIEAKMCKIEEQLATSKKKTSKIEETSIRNFEIETLISYLNISH